MAEVRWQSVLLRPWQVELGLIVELDAPLTFVEDEVVAVSVFIGR